MSNTREMAYALLRVTLGVIFLFYGIGKFMGGVSAFASGMEADFAKTALPSVLVLPFGYILPFVEVILGVLLVLGLFNVPALALAGLLMIVLTFGAVMESHSGTVAHNLGFALVIFVLLWLAEHNGYALDRLRRGGAQE